MSQEEYKVNYGSMLLSIIMGGLCIFLLTVTMFSKGFDIPVKSWPWFIGCYIANLFIQMLLYSSARGLTKA